jgi:hypothetical protein
VPDDGTETLTPDVQYLTRRLVKRREDEIRGEEEPRFRA